MGSNVESVQCTNFTHFATGLKTRDRLVTSDLP